MLLFACILLDYFLVFSVIGSVKVQLRQSVTNPLNDFSLRNTLKQAHLKQILHYLGNIFPNSG